MKVLYRLFGLLKQVIALFFPILRCKPRDGVVYATYAEANIVVDRTARIVGRGFVRADPVRGVGR